MPRQEDGPPNYFESQQLTSLKLTGGTNSNKAHHRPTATTGQFGQYTSYNNGGVITVALGTADDQLGNGLLSDNLITGR